MPDKSRIYLAPETEQETRYTCSLEEKTEPMIDGLDSDNSSPSPSFDQIGPSFLFSGQTPATTGDKRDPLYFPGLNQKLNSSYK